MLAWLKRKPTTAPSEQLVEEDADNLTTDERLERLLGRLGSDRRERTAPATAPVAERTLVLAPEKSSAGAPPPSESKPPPAAGDTIADRSAVEPENLTIARRGGGPSAAELLAKGYSFGSGPDGKMVIFDAEGNVAESPPAAPDPDSAAGEPRTTAPRDVISPSAAVSDATPPSATVSDPTPPAVEALQPPEPRPAAKRARKRPPAAVEEIEPPSNGSVAPIQRGGAFQGMYVIAVASQKGGSGKTTVAAHLAVRAAAAGHGPVVLIDTDPQGSLAEWWHAREDETPALAQVRPEMLAANLAELRSYGTAIAIIDTPPALTGSIEQVIAMADLVLIPARPSPHDLRAAAGTVEMAQNAGKPFMFVVNGASPRASITAQAVAALSEHGRVAPVILYQRTEYAASMIDGRTVSETAASGRSAQEIAELWQCVYAQIGLRVAA